MQGDTSEWWFKLLWSLRLTPFSKAHWASWLKLGSKQVALACVPWYGMISYPMRCGMHSILCPHPNSSRTKTSVEGVSVLQSWTMIHVATIPNHEAVISFWGGNKGSTYMQLLPAICSFKLKFLWICYCYCCHLWMRTRSTQAHAQKQEWDMSYKNFYYDLYNAKPVRSTDWAVKENY